MVSMVLLCDGGKPVTKSIAMWDQGQLGTGRGGGADQEVDNERIYLEHIQYKQPHTHL